MIKNCLFCCVCKESSTYNEIYVNRLIQDFQKHNTHNIQPYCITNVQKNKINLSKEFILPLKYNWPRWWPKLELFRPDIHGDIFYIDLDSIVRKNIDNILSIMLKIKNPIMLSDFLKPRYLASGMMWLPEDYRRMIWEIWIKNPNKYMKQYKKGGDQAFIREIIGKECLRWQNILPKNTVVSLKKHCRKQTPEAASIICYHGRPRPHEINWSETFIPNWWEKKY